MSNIFQVLMTHADTIRSESPEEIAVNLLVKKAGISEEDARYQVAQHTMEKAACAALAKKGIDHDDAVKMVKAANLNIRDMPGFVLTPSKQSPMNDTADILVKAAEYIQSLEYDLAELQVQAESLEKTASEYRNAMIHVPEPIEQMHQHGAISDADMSSLRSLDPSLLEKIAGNSSDPWSMGSGAGRSVQSMDPFTAWILN